MVRYVWWSEHERLCASGVLTSVRGHFKGLTTAPQHIRGRYSFAKVVAEKGRVWSDKYLSSNSPCPDCERPTHYYSRGRLEHAWFDTIGYKWATHRCMAKPDTKCQPSMAALNILPPSKAKKRRPLLLRKKLSTDTYNKDLLQKQKDSPIATNHQCSHCEQAVYEFKSASDILAYFDTVFPDWVQHRCQTKQVSDFAKPDSGYINLSDLKNAVNNTTSSPALKRHLTEQDFVGLPYILCRVLAVTKHQNGFRLRLNPASLPKVDIVVFGRFFEPQVKGVKFVYLKNNCIKFLSQQSLKPLEAEIEYYDIRSM